MYHINGTSIETLAEIHPTADIRNASSLTTSTGIRFWGHTYQAATGRKFIINRTGYIYSGDANNGRYRSAGFYNLARKGHRPRMTFAARRWDSSTPATLFVNKFADGEVWVSTTHNARSGTRISTAAEDIRFVFVMLIGPGGGGGGGSGTRAGGGGGGGAFTFFCHQLVVGRVHRLTIGSGGAGGARNTNGGMGSNTQFATFQDTSFATGFTTMNTTGGGGGRSGGDGGDGGVGGEVPWPSSNSSLIHRLNEHNGTRGGDRGGNLGGSTAALRTTAYTPEGNRLDYGQGASNASSGSGGSGGGGWFWGHNGGAGGGDGSPGGIGAGGGGGQWVIFAGNPGGRGGNGYAALFY